jgi:hypothetical protein
MRTPEVVKGFDDQTDSLRHAAAISVNVAFVSRLARDAGRRPDSRRHDHVLTGLAEW